MNIFHAFRDRLFDEIDENNNGKIEFGELLMMAETMMSKRNFEIQSKKLILNTIEHQFLHTCLKMKRPLKPETSCAMSIVHMTKTFALV